MKLFNVTIVLCILIGAFFFMSGTKQSFSNTDLSSLSKSDAPVVVELFTSQGCSSCPPADRLAEALNARDNLYILTCHVTYWDYIGWKDTLGLEECNTRQRQYAKAAGSSRVYTPQVLINGHIDVVGNNKSGMIKAINVAQGQTIRKIGIVRDGNTLNLDLPDLERKGNNTIRFMMVKKSETTPIGRGENRNETVTYVQNVIGIYNMGTWNGQSETKSFDLPNNPNANEIVILVNGDRFGAVSAVGKYSY